MLFTVCIAMPINAKNYAILVLPCGGATSIISAALLHHLERNTGQPAKQLFNEIWGASAGSIIAALLTAGKYKKARDVVRFFKQHFHSYRAAYFIRQAAGNAIGSDVLIKQTAIPIRILTAASQHPAQNSWQLYDFSTDGNGTNHHPLADIVKASCTVYPYLYRTPISFSVNNQTMYCIDPGSLVCNPPTTDPTAYFLQQLLPRLTSQDTVTIYFLANAFTPSIDYFDVLNVLENNAEKNSYTIYEADDGSCGNQPRKQIEIINIPVRISCEEIFEHYLRHTNGANRMIIRLLQRIFERIVGKENAVPNLLAAGVVPVEELEKEATKIIRSSPNYAIMVKRLKNRLSS
jgi:hypothetical protein